MELEKMLLEEIPDLCRRREFRGGNKVYRPGETIHDGEDHHVPLGRWQTCDEVHGDMGPGTAWSREPREPGGRTYTGHWQGRRQQISWYRWRRSATKNAGKGGEGFGQLRSGTPDRRSGLTAGRPSALPWGQTGCLGAPLRGPPLPSKPPHLLLHLPGGHPADAVGREDRLRILADRVYRELT